jgi:hypothetical protein
MANRYFVPGGNFRWNASDTTNWSATSGGPGGASVPTSSDDVFLDANSGTAINFFVGFCRSINGTGFTGQLAWQLGSQPLYNYGDVVFPSSMQVTSPGMFSFPQISFLGTTHNLTANTVLTNTTLVLGANAVVNAITPLNFRRIDFNTNAVFNSYNNNLSFDFLGPAGAGSILSLGTSTVTVRDDWVKPSNLLIFDSGNSTLLVAGDFDGGNATYGTVTISGQSDSYVSLLNGRINNTLTINSTTTNPGQNTRSIFSNIRAGNVVFSGVDANSGRLFIVGVGGVRDIWSTNSSATFNNVSFRNISSSGLQNAGGNRSEDCGNNSGITFTSTTVQSTGSGDWTTGSTWSGGNMPLTQDNVLIIGGDVRWNRGASGFTLGCANLSGSGQLNLDNQTITVSGNLQYSGFIYSGNITMEGPSFSSLYVTQSSSVNLSSNLFSLNINSATQLNTLNINNGATFSAPVNVGSLILFGTVNLGNNTHTISSSFTNNAILTATQATLQLAGNINPLTFDAGSAAYKEVRVLGTGGNGVINITGSPQINTLSRTGTESFTLQFPASTTINSWLVSGVPGKLVTVTSNTTVSTLNYSGIDTVAADYLTVSKITGSPANTWYVGSNSVNGGNNTQVYFSPPFKGNGLFFGSNF